MLIERTQATVDDPAVEAARALIEQFPVLSAQEVDRARRTGRAGGAIIVTRHESVSFGRATSGSVPVEEQGEAAGLRSLQIDACLVGNAAVKLPRIELFGIEIGQVESFRNGPGKLDRPR
jgi:hypothetical protein